MKITYRPFTFLNLSLLAAFASLALPIAQAQINYQGSLTDAEGAPLGDGQYVIQFSLWDDATDGAQLWGPFLADGGAGDGHGPLADLVDGRFNVIIGNLDTGGDSLTTSMSVSTSLYLEIKVGEAEAISPRQIILPAPRALLADVIPNVTPTSSGVDIAGDAAISGDSTVSGSSTVAVDSTVSGNSTVAGNSVVSGNLNVGVIDGAFDGKRVTVSGNRYGFVHTDGTRELGTFVNSSTIGLGTKNNYPLSFFVNNGSNDIYVATSHNVGIGTSNPTQAKFVVSGSGTGATGMANSRYFNVGVTSLSLGGNNGMALSIYATHPIAATGFFSYSDERIKFVEGRSDTKRDLSTLLGIQVTDYTYIDRVAQGSAPKKKVIAQQVEKVFPQAVSKITDVVPDIYKQASYQDGWVQLATDLKAGDRVKLISETTEGIHEVLEVTKSAFRTDFKPEADKVFVYGREVDDFRTVDYEAISMLNVSATQELHRRLAKQERELTYLREANASLTQKLGKLEKGGRTIEARMARMERAFHARMSIQNRELESEDRVSQKPAGSIKDASVVARLAQP